VGERARTNGVVVGAVRTETTVEVPMHRLLSLGRAVRHGQEAVCVGVEAVVPRTRRIKRTEDAGEEGTVPRLTMMLVLLVTRATGLTMAQLTGPLMMVLLAIWMPRLRLAMVRVASSGKWEDLWGAARRKLLPPRPRKTKTTRVTTVEM
jgi:hypothetical protein